jgi:uncharacterized protein YqeY
MSGFGIGIDASMALTEDITRAIAEAMKAKDQIRLVALRMLKSALTNREIDPWTTRKAARW